MFCGRDVRFLVTHWFVSFVCVLAVATAGCGGKGGYSGPTGTVSGKVTLNGQPVPKGTISFINENLAIHGAAILNSDGSYALKSGTTFAIPVGDYRVGISGSSATDAPPPDPMELMANPEKFKENDSIPPKYRDPKTSGLLVVVKAGSNSDVNFDLK